MKASPEISFALGFGLTHPDWPTSKPVPIDYYCLFIVMPPSYCCYERPSCYRASFRLAKGFLDLFIVLVMRGGRFGYIWRSSMPHRLSRPVLARPAEQLGDAGVRRLLR